jgi:hypothetical protein
MDSDLRNLCRKLKFTVIDEVLLGTILWETFSEEFSNFRKNLLFVHVISLHLVEFPLSLAKFLIVISGKFSAFL